MRRYANQQRESGPACRNKPVGIRTHAHLGSMGARWLVLQPGRRRKSQLRQSCWQMCLHISVSLSMCVCQRADIVEPQPKQFLVCGNTPCLTLNWAVSSLRPNLSYYFSAYIPRRERGQLPVDRQRVPGLMRTLLRWRNERRDSRAHRSIFVHRPRSMGTLLEYLERIRQAYV